MENKSALVFTLLVCFLALLQYVVNGIESKFLARALYEGGQSFFWLINYLQFGGVWKLGAAAVLLLLGIRNIVVHFVIRKEMSAAADESPESETNKSKNTGPRSDDE